MYRFVPAFICRKGRDYPYDAAGNILGYLSEVDSSFFETARGQRDVRIGDYTGKDRTRESWEGAYGTKKE